MNCKIRVMKHNILFKVLGALKLKSAIKMLVMLSHSEHSEGVHCAFTDITVLPPYSEDRGNLKTSNITKVTRISSAHG